MGKWELERPVSDSTVESRVEEQSMSVARIVGLLFVLLTAVCADVRGAPPSGPAQTGATQGGATAVEPGARPATLSTTHTTGQSVTKIDSPGANTPAKVSASPAPVERLRTKEGAAPALERQQASLPLDLASLKNLLKETKAISLFSKIALKNQVDDLLIQFRAYYQGSRKTTLAELRQRYDLLLLKVLSLLQDGDQPLATAIGASRESIWGILADREKFATI
jgi:hypothetical protein